LTQSDASGSTFAVFLPANGGAAAESTKVTHPQRGSTS
jgi:hypothetical protein